MTRQTNEGDIMEITQTAISYCLEMTNEQFTKILDRDEKESLSSYLIPLMEKEGAIDVNYDGLFGAAVFFTLETEQNHKLGEVCNTVKNYIK